MKALVVMEDRQAARLLERDLRGERFVVDLAYNGETGGEMASTNRYDLVILDWLLPDVPGIRLCRDLRSRGISTPILMLIAPSLMLTAQDAPEDRVAGLHSGADVYLAKPFAFAELLARIHALLRRSELPRPAESEVANLTLDPLGHRVTRNGVSVSLTPTEYAILKVLMRHPGEIVTQSTLAERVWGVGHEKHKDLLDLHVQRLRQKIDAEEAAPLIRAVRGQGYILVPPDHSAKPSF